MFGLPTEACGPSWWGRHGWHQACDGDAHTVSTVGEQRDGCWCPAGLLFMHSRTPTHEMGPYTFSTQSHPTKNTPEDTPEVCFHVYSKSQQVTEEAFTINELKCKLNSTGRKENKCLMNMHGGNCKRDKSLKREKDDGCRKVKQTIRFLGM